MARKTLSSTQVYKEIGLKPNDHLMDSIREESNANHPNPDRRESLHELRRKKTLIDNPVDEEDREQVWGDKDAEAKEPVNYQNSIKDSNKLYESEMVIDKDNMLGSLVDSGVFYSMTDSKTSQVIADKYLGHIEEGMKEYITQVDDPSDEHWSDSDKETEVNDFIEHFDNQQKEDFWDTNEAIARNGFNIAHQFKTEVGNRAELSEDLDNSQLSQDSNNPFGVQVFRDRMASDDDSDSDPHGLNNGDHLSDLQEDIELQINSFYQEDFDIKSLPSDYLSQLGTENLDSLLKENGVKKEEGENNLMSAIQMKDSLVENQLSYRTQDNLEKYQEEFDLDKSKEDDDSIKTKPRTMTEIVENSKLLNPGTNNVDPMTSNFFMKSNWNSRPEESPIFEEIGDEDEIYLSDINHIGKQRDVDASVMGEIGLNMLNDNLHDSLTQYEESRKQSINNPVDQDLFKKQYLEDNYMSQVSVAMSYDESEQIDQQIEQIEREFELSQHKLRKLKDEANLFKDDDDDDNY